MPHNRHKQVMFEEKLVRAQVTRVRASVNSVGGESVLVVMHVVGCVDVASTWDDSCQIMSTSTPLQIYAEYLKKRFL